MLQRFLRTGRGISFSRMFAMKEYPRDVMPLYAQGYTLAEFLIAQGGRRRYVAYVEDGLKSSDWSEATRRHYGIENLGVLQNQWLAWVGKGCPPLETIAGPKPDSGQLAGVNQRNADGSKSFPKAHPDKPAPDNLAAGKRPRPEPNLIYHVPKDQTAVIAASHTAPIRKGAAPTMPESGWQVADAKSAPGERLVPVNPRPLPSGLSRTVQPQLTRPQPPQQSSQIILEWRRR